MAVNAGFENYIRSAVLEAANIIRTLCNIPAPSHHEEKRAEFCAKWFRDNGFPRFRWTHS